MKETFELSDGRAVTVKSAWDCDKSVSLIDVYDADDVVRADHVYDLFC